MDCHLRSLYICVRDMSRAVKFYERFFEKPVAHFDEIYSVFDIDGFRFGLFAFAKMNEEHVFGNNCLPSIDVADLSTLRQKLNGLDVVFPLKQIGPNWVCEFADSEGNHIELTAPVRGGVTEAQ